MYWHKNCIKFFPHLRTSHFLNLLPCLRRSDMFGSDNRASSQKKPLTSFPSEVIHSFNSGKQIVQQFHGHTRCQEFQNVIFPPKLFAVGILQHLLFLLLHSCSSWSRLEGRAVAQHGHPQQGTLHGPGGQQPAVPVPGGKRCFRALRVLIWPQGPKGALQMFSCKWYRRDDQLVLLWYSVISAP